MNPFRPPPLPPVEVFTRAAYGDPLAEIEIGEWRIESRRASLRLQNFNAFLQATLIVALFPMNSGHTLGRFAIAGQVACLVLILWLRHRTIRNWQDHNM